MCFISTKPKWYLTIYYDLHTYIIGHYNPSNKIIGRVSHNTYVVCVRFRTTDFLRNFSWQFNTFSEFLPEICWEEIAEKMLFVFCFDVWYGARTLAFSSNKPAHYLLDHGNFIHDLRNTNKLSKIKFYQAIIIIIIINTFSKNMVSFKFGTSGIQNPIKNACAYVTNITVGTHVNNRDNLFGSARSL